MLKPLQSYICYHALFCLKPTLIISSQLEIKTNEDFEAFSLLMFIRTRKVKLSAQDIFCENCLAWLGFCAICRGNISANAF